MLGGCAVVGSDGRIMVGKGHRARVSQPAGARHGCWGGTGRRERFVIHMGGGGPRRNKQRVTAPVCTALVPPVDCPAPAREVGEVARAAAAAALIRSPRAERPPQRQEQEGGGAGQAAEEDPHARGTAARAMSRFGTLTHSRLGSGMRWNCSGTEPPRPSAGFSDQTLSTRHTRSRLPLYSEGCAGCWALGSEPWWVELGGRRNAGCVTPPGGTVPCRAWKQGDP